MFSNLSQTLPSIRRFRLNFGKRTYKFRKRILERFERFRKPAARKFLRIVACSVISIWSEHATFATRLIISTRTSVFQQNRVHRNFNYIGVIQRDFVIKISFRRIISSKLLVWRNGAINNATGEVVRTRQGKRFRAPANYTRSSERVIYNDFRQTWPTREFPCTCAFLLHPISLSWKRTTVSRYQIGPVGRSRPWEKFPLLICEKSARILPRKTELPRFHSKSRVGVFFVDRWSYRNVGRIRFSSLLSYYNVGFQAERSLSTGGFVKRYTLTEYSRSFFAHGCHDRKRERERERESVLPVDEDEFRFCRQELEITEEVIRAIILLSWF